MDSPWTVHAKKAPTGRLFRRQLALKNPFRWPLVCDSPASTWAAKIGRQQTETKSGGQTKRQAKVAQWPHSRVAVSLLLLSLVVVMFTLCRLEHVSEQTANSERHTCTRLSAAKQTIGQNGRPPAGHTARRLTRWPDCDWPQRARSLLGRQTETRARQRERGSDLFGTVCSWRSSTPHLDNFRPRPIGREQERPLEKSLAETTSFPSANNTQLPLAPCSWGALIERPDPSSGARAAA